MKNFMNILAVFTLFLFTFYPVSASAIPELGVAPSPDEEQVYYGDYADYLDYFAAYFLPGTDGFSMPFSSGSLTVWFGFNDGFSADEKNIDVYLATDSLSGGSFKFNGTTFGTIGVTKGQADGYKDVDPDTAGTQYYAINLGSINDGGWTPAPSDSPFYDGSSKEFYFYTGTIEYSDFLFGEEWMFSLADIGGFVGQFDNGVDAFSPKTASTSHEPIPEPATIFFFGTGLIGIGVLGRKRFMES